MSIPSTSSAHAPLRLVLGAFTMLALLVGLIGAIDRGIDNDPDWRDLQFETRWTWNHGRTAPGTAMFGYLPATTFALLPFAVWLPPPVGVLAYIFSNLLALGATFYLLHRDWRDPNQDPLVWAGVPALAAVNLAHGLQSNQTTLWTLGLCVGGLTFVHRKRPLLGGFLIGSAAMFKVMPGLLAAYLLLRGRWRALGGFVLAVLIVDLLPSMLFFGPAGAIAEHRAWLRRAAWHGNEHLIDQPLLRVHRHGTNSAFAALLTRWLRALPDADEQIVLYGDPPSGVIERFKSELPPRTVLTLDPMPPHDGAAWSEKRVSLAWVPRFHVADLPPRVIHVLWAAPLLVGFGLLFWRTWHTRRQADNDWPAVSALWMLAMFWPSPMLRHYYLAWALPALLVVVQSLSRFAAASPARRLAQAALIAWAVATLAMGSKVFRWYGIHVFALALLTLACAQACRRPRAVE